MKRVLIVEDDREIRGLLKDFLEENKYEVSEARDGNVASELINNEKYDIILMDMMLPFKSGDILIQELRELKDTAKNSTPVIVLSAKTMNTEQLISFKRSFEKKCRGGIKLQLESSGEADSVEGFTV